MQLVNQKWVAMEPLKLYSRFIFKLLLYILLKGWNVASDKVSHGI